MAERDDAGRRAEQPGQPIEAQLTRLARRQHAQGRPPLIAEHLPGNEVRMVFEFGDQHLVARADVRAAERLRDEVDRLGRTARKHNLLHGRRPEQLARRTSRRLVERGGRLAERVRAPVHVGALVLEGAPHGLDDRAGFKGRRGVVEVHEGPAVHPLIERREVGAQRLDVEGRRLER
jgi:hypothetical protein